MTDRVQLESQALDEVLALNITVGADLERFTSQEGVSTARLHLLWLLGDTGPSTQSALAAGLGVTPRNITGLVDGVVESGHATRQPHPRDRRATLVTLTDQGEEFVTRLQSGHVELAGQLFGALTAPELGRFVETLRATRERFEQQMLEATR